jgi:hypothetical protein
VDGLGHVIFFALALVFALVQAIRQSKAKRAWQAAAAELGLEITPRGLFSHDQMHGQVDGISVRLEEAKRDKGGTTRLDVYLPDVVPPDLRLWAEGARSRVAAVLLGETDVQTGDELFDAKVHVRGEEVEVLARLGEATRRALRSVLPERKATVESGALTLEWSGIVTEASTFVSAVRELTQVARLLCLDEGGVPAALARNAVSDSNAQVRLRNLDVLCRKYPRSETARTAAERALNDPDRHIRLRAAQFLPGETAGAVLSALVRSPGNPSMRAEALRDLARKCEYAEISATVQVALDSAEEELQQEAVKVIARAGDHAKVDALGALAATASSPLAETLAEALGRLGGSGAEEALLHLLAHQSDRVRCQAAQALGAVGTVRAVEPLLPLTRRLLEGDLRQAAREAVRRIQSRLGAVEAGRLAVVEDQGGAVSLAAPVGAVAVVEVEDREGKPRESDGEGGARAVRH